MTVKSLSAYLVVDWRDEDLKVRKTKPETSPYEVAVPLDLEIEVPEVDVQTLSARLEVPQAHVHKIVQGEVHEEDLTDWQAEAERILMDYQETGELALDDSIQTQILGEVMMESPGVPDPESVSDYIQVRMGELVET